MKLWWITNHTRLEIEKSSVEGLGASSDWFKFNDWALNAERLSAVGEITANGHSYPIRLIYPDRFPMVPAWVEPQDPEAKWSSHQYGAGGSLCLELRPDNWDPNATGADVLRSAFNLLEAENPLGSEDGTEVLSAHFVTEVQSYDWRSHPVLISAGCYDRIKENSAKDVSAIRWSVQDDIWPILISDSIDRLLPEYPSSFDIGTLRMPVKLFLSRQEMKTQYDGSRADFARSVGIEVPDIPESEGVVFVTGSDELAAFHSPNDDKVYLRKWIILRDTFGERSGHGPHLASASVGIVGIGSVGSKVAESMLRAGTRELTLVDGDVFLPANIERHALDWRDIGFRKVQAMKRRLLQIVHGAKITVIESNLNWQISAKNQASQIDTISNCDLIVDATGDESTSLYLGELANYNHKPFLSVKVFEGGIGCIVAVSVPGVDPCYGKGFKAYLAWCDEQGVNPPPTGKRSYEALSDAGNVMIADDAAVSVAAAHASRSAIDVLRSDARLQPTPWLLIGLNEGWHFEGHGHTIHLNVGEPTIEDCVRNLGDQTADFIRHLVQEAVDEANDSK